MTYQPALGVRNVELKTNNLVLVRAVTLTQCKI